MHNWFHNLARLVRSIWRLRPYLRGGRHLLAAVLATAGVAAALEIIAVALMAPMFSLLLGGEEATEMRPIRWLHEWLPGHGPGFYVLVFCGLVLGAVLAKNLVLYGCQVLAAWLKKRITINLRESLFSRMIDADLRVLEQRAGGELAGVFLTETYRTISAVDYMLLFAQRSSIAVCYLGVLLYFSVTLSALSAAVGGITAVSVGLLNRRLSAHGQRSTKLNEALGSRVVESFAGIRVIRASGAQGQVRAQFQGINEEQAQIEESATRITALAPPLAETLGVAGAMVVLALASNYLVVPHGPMLRSHLLVYCFTLFRLLPLANQLYGLIGHLLYLSGGVAEVERWLAVAQFPARAFGRTRFEKVTDALRFEGVTYEYPGGKRALDHVTFRIPAGQMVALVGASGSGKTTAVALLTRLREPSAGRIAVDGRDYWEFSGDSWHRAVAVVEQEAFLFHDTVARNVSYGCLDATPAQIAAAIRIAHLEDVVEALPRGLETVVGERGVTLSGGQRQRLAIARAVVREPQILLLDEATSALDNLSERQVQAALEAAMRGRTVLVIAHRLSTIRNAHHIVVLDDGRVAEQGGWDELMAAGGVFARLVKTGGL